MIAKPAVQNVTKRSGAHQEGHGVCEVRRQTRMPRRCRRAVCQPATTECSVCITLRMESNMGAQHALSECGQPRLPSLVHSIPPSFFFLHLGAEPTER